MVRRGWTEESIEKTVEKPYAASEATNKATGGDATAYFNKDGTYVVKDNQTNQIIQASDKNKPNWVPDDSIVKPYIPSKK